MIHVIFGVSKDKNYLTKVCVMKEKFRDKVLFKPFEGLDFFDAGTGKNKADKEDSILVFSIVLSVFIL